MQMFYDWQRNSRDLIVPEIHLADAFLPPHSASTYWGQEWAAGDSAIQNYGGTIESQNNNWTASAGLFRSVRDTFRGYSDLYDETQSNELSLHHILINYPQQRSSSTSGELRLVRHFGTGAQRQDIIFSIRGRHVDSRYGGTDTQDAGPALIGQGVQIPRPNFIFSPLTRDPNRLLLAGVAFRGQ